MEPWSGSRPAFTNLLNMIARLQPRWCLLLSGDVHYAYVAAAAVAHQSGATRPLELVQFTSSALKNPSPGIVRAVAVIDAAMGGTEGTSPSRVSDTPGLIAWMQLLVAEEGQSVFNKSNLGHVRIDAGFGLYPTLILLGQNGLDERTYNLKRAPT
jgi:hypothetical protein